MTEATLEQANQALRAAVTERLNSSTTEPRVTTWSTETANSESYAEWLPPAYATPSAAEVLRRFNQPQHGSAEWIAALERLRALHHEKTAQYGGNADAFENVTASARCGVEPWRRALCDLSDCVVRMQKFACGQPVDPTNALLDAANWALICLVKLEETQRA